MVGHGINGTAPGHAGNIFIRTINNISSLCGVIAATMIVVSVGITCQMIFVRFVLNESTIWQTEAVVYLMVAATLIGLPYVQRHRGHVNVDLIPLMLNQSYQTSTCNTCVDRFHSRRIHHGVLWIWSMVRSFPQRLDLRHSLGRSPGYSLSRLTCGLWTIPVAAGC